MNHLREKVPDGKKGTNMLPYISVTISKCMHNKYKKY